LRHTHPGSQIVQLTTSTTIDLPASGTVGGVEPLVVDAGQRAMRAAVQAVCQEYERQGRARPRCGSTTLQSRGTTGGAWREAGEAIGGGMVEREVALIINRGMKHQGVHAAVAQPASAANRH
jgi:hypothetical protein